MTIYTLSPAGTAKCAVSKCDSPRAVWQPAGPNYATNQHTTIGLYQLIEMGNAGWLCVPWMRRHVSETL